MDARALTARQKEARGTLRPAGPSAFATGIFRSGTRARTRDRPGAYGSRNIGAIFARVRLSSLSECAHALRRRALRRTIRESPVRPKRVQSSEPGTPSSRRARKRWPRTRAGRRPGVCTRWGERIHTRRARRWSVRGIFRRGEPGRASANFQTFASRDTV